MKVSIIIICDRIREDKLNRLLRGLKPQLSRFQTEVLLIHETNHRVTLPSLPCKIHYFPIPPQRGIPFNRNQGIKRARGKIIVFIDDDCWVTKQWLASLINPLLKDKKAWATTGGTKVPPSNFLGDCIAALGFPGGGSLGFEKMWKVVNGLTNHLSVGNCALRKEIFDKVGLFDESLKLGAEDAEFSVRLERTGILINYVPEAYAFHEARTTLSSFFRWQLRRGRANYHFKKRIGKVKSFVQLRMWSAKNIIKQNAMSIKLPFIVGLLGISLILQQSGYLMEKGRNFYEIKN